jgi:hypothetical protein
VDTEHEFHGSGNLEYIGLPHSPNGELLRTSAASISCPCRSGFPAARSAGVAI